MANTYSETAKIFKAFSDEKRLQILALLQSGEKCACVLLESFEISQPTFSHHMKILTESGVVSGRKKGKWTHYSISESGAKYAAQLLKSMTSVQIDGKAAGGESA
ncbi:metalloregulator ArsR/SmtB family transcription factor [Clostridiaceae bacterium OttesenSCG-928-D20]|nr:metalloregulator ArsR/SmtB family transcription factor [Clostridiaceae bacterium OttesenSCG-928-D20]